MKTILALIFSALALVAVAADGVVAAGVQLEKLADGFAFTEGPTCDAKGNLYFTDQPNDRILKWSTRGKLTTFLQPAGRANGLMFDAQGNLIACAEARNELWSIAPDKTVTVHLSHFGQGHAGGVELGREAHHVGVAFSRKDALFEGGRQQAHADRLALNHYIAGLG